MRNVIKSTVMMMTVLPALVMASEPGRLVYEKFKPLTPALQAKTSQAIANRGGTAEIEALLYYQNSFMATFGLYEGHLRLEERVASVNAAFVESGIDAVLKIVDIVPITSISDDIPFDNVFDEDGNVISDGAGYLASLNIQNQGTLEYEINQKWKSDLLGYMRELRAEDGSKRGSAGIGGDFFNILDDGIDTTTWAHEIGHNLGAHHEIETAQNPTIPYQHAYTCDGKNTIMWSSGGGLNNGTISGDGKHKFYSTPDREEGGEACGTEFADNTRVLNENLARAEADGEGVVSKGNVSFVQSSYAVLEDEDLIIELIRDGELSETASVKVFAYNDTALWGEDFTDVFVEVEFLEGEAKARATFNIVNDTVEEDNETFTLALKYPYRLTATEAQSQVVIQPVVAVGYSGLFSLTGPESAEEDQDAVYTITRTGGSDGDVVINAKTTPGTAISGNDYAPFNENIVFADGEVEKYFTIEVGEDTLVEVTETLLVNISSAAVVDIDVTQLTLQIEDNDSVPLDGFTLSTNVTSASESVGSILFVVSREGGYVGDVAGSVVAAFSNGDNAISADFRLPEGVASIEVVLTIPNNTTDENNYTMEVSLSLPDGIKVVVGDISIVIIDDDVALTTPTTPSTDDSGSGGGAFGWMLILLLVLRLKFK
jgi:hypothetical protein